jgi:hypothetical protein
MERLTTDPVSPVLEVKPDLGQVLERLSAVLASEGRRVD